jgi:hypothetical protein
MLQAIRDEAPNTAVNHLSFSTSERNEATKTGERKERNFLITFHEDAEGD